MSQSAEAMTHFGLDGTEEEEECKRSMREFYEKYRQTFYSDRRKI